MREPEKRMWEVASLRACHSLHMLSVAEVPDQPWREANKAPHCEVLDISGEKKRVIKKRL